KRITTLILLIFCSSILANQNSNNFESKLRNAMDLVFNFKFKEAEQNLLELSEQKKSDSRPLLYLSNIYVWKFLGDKKKSDFEKFEQYSKETIERAENNLKRNANDVWSYYSLSSIYGYRSLMYFMNRDYVEGLWAVKKSMSWSNELIQKNPDFFDGYLWRGIISFSLHQVPATFRGLLSLIGFNGDIKQGLKEIQLVSRKGDLAKVEADYFLSQFYSSSLNDNRRAYELLIELSSKYPDNELFVYSTAIELIKLHRLNEARVHLNRLINNNSIEIKAIKELSYFLLGDCFFYLNEFEKAIENYELFVSKHNQVQYKPTAYFRSGVAFYFLNDKSKAKHFLEKASAIESKNSEDKFYQRYAKKIINSNFDERILRIFYGWNFLRAGRFENAIDIFNGLLNSKVSSDLKIVATYLKGLSYYKLNDSTKARRFLKETLRFETTTEVWAKAFSYLYLARVEFNAKNYQAAENYINQLMKLDDYDFENSVYSQAKNLLERIKNNF
ncbi:MAG: tetratricopeptide repeat protein, partial [Ignavibacteria bacterium]